MFVIFIHAVLSVFVWRSSYLLQGVSDQTKLGVIDVQLLLVWIYTTEVIQFHFHKFVRLGQFKDLCSWPVFEVKFAEEIRTVPFMPSTLICTTYCSEFQNGSSLCRTPASVQKHEYISLSSSTVSYLLPQQPLAISTLTYLSHKVCLL
jgi:hypothetical protein